MECELNFTNRYQILVKETGCVAYQPLNRASVSNRVLLPNIYFCGLFPTEIR